MSDQEQTTPEQAVLGAALIRTTAYAEAALILTGEDFEHPTERAVWEAMGSIVRRSGSIDVLTLEDELVTLGNAPRPEGGLGSYAVKLAASVPTAENVRHYAAIVAKRSAIRRGRAALLLAAEAFETDQDQVERYLLEAQRYADQVRRGRRRPEVDMADLVFPMLKEFEARSKALAEGGAKVVGLSTGITGLDYLTSGLRNGSLNIVAARTSLGKTAYACQLALLGAVADGVPCLFFSLEMRPEELMERFYARLAKVDSARLRVGDIDMEENRRLGKAGAKMNYRDLLLISNSRSLSAIGTEARAFRIRHPGQQVLIVVDYLQLVRTGGRGRTRELEVAEVAETLKELAVELDCPIVAPAQFGRGPEQEDREPRITDIRESGAIENTADLIMFIVRRRDESSGEGRMRVEKNRNGQVGEVAIRWHGPTYEISDADDTPPPGYS